MECGEIQPALFFENSQLNQSTLMQEGTCTSGVCCASVRIGPVSSWRESDQKSVTARSFRIHVPFRAHCKKAACSSGGFFISKTYTCGLRSLSVRVLQILRKIHHLQIFIVSQPLSPIEKDPFIRLAFERAKALMDSDHNPPKIRFNLFSSSAPHASKSMARIFPCGSTRIGRGSPTTSNLSKIA
jgi:hypothetical protein